MSTGPTGAIQQLLTSTQYLLHYNPEWPIKLNCDPSPVGLGSVLLHVIPDGTERPIAYASRPLEIHPGNWPQTFDDLGSISANIWPITEVGNNSDGVLVQHYVPLNSVTNKCSRVISPATDNYRNNPN